MSVLAWLVLAIVLLLVEMLTPGIFYFACFSLGAFATTIIAMLEMPIWVEWSVFFAISLLAIFLVVPIARRWMKKIPNTPVGLDSLEGQVAHVVEDIDPVSGQGQVRLSNGAIWRAVSDASIAKGVSVEVIRVTGTRLQVSSSLNSNSSKE
ncbi:MAG: NfeD family protein [Holophagaceae bacterium]|nr:NfeD family protein [Holophagaceae bacterium]